MVVDNAAVENPLQKKAMKMATPEGVKLSILTTEKAIENLKSGKYGEQRIFFVCASPKVLADFLDAGIKVPQITIGNLVGGEGKKRVYKSFVSPEEEAWLEKLSAAGIPIHWQGIPGDTRMEFMSMLRKGGTE